MQELVQADVLQSCHSAPFVKECFIEEKTKVDCR